MTDSPPVIDAALVRRLVAAQFPQWVDLPISPVQFGGWDNRTFHLGDNMSVRLPSAAGYAAQVAKEHRWLPHLAAQLPLPIPTPLALGVPGEGYPWPWSIYRWLDGQTAANAPIADRREFAVAVAGFLSALHAVGTTGGPPPGDHNFWRGGPLSVYDAETWRSIAALEGEIDGEGAATVWTAALAATWQGPPVWVHGDVAAGNLLVQDGRLSAVIDFGGTCVGDPACDLVLAWTFFSGESRAAFFSGVPVDDAAWARGRGWALWKALITVVGARSDDPQRAAESRHIIGEVIADHRRNA